MNVKDHFKEFFTFLADLVMPSMQIIFSFLVDAAIKNPKIFNEMVARKPPVSFLPEILEISPINYTRHQSKSQWSSFDNPECLAVPHQTLQTVLR